MKVCSQCQREYEDHFHFCTRDGIKLTRIEERGYCRRCGKDYPMSLRQCPLHETPLNQHGPRTILGDNLCHLCDSDYPKEFKLCPVHGISLQTNPLKRKEHERLKESLVQWKKEKFDSQIDAARAREVSDAPKQSDDSAPQDLAAASAIDDIVTTNPLELFNARFDPMNTDQTLTWSDRTVVNGGYDWHEGGHNEALRLGPGVGNDLEFRPVDSGDLVTNGLLLSQVGFDRGLMPQTEQLGADLKAVKRPGRNEPARRRAGAGKRLAPYRPSRRLASLSAMVMLAIVASVSGYLWLPRGGTAARAKSDSQVAANTPADRNANSGSGNLPAGSQGVASLTDTDQLPVNRIAPIVSNGAVVRSFTTDAATRTQTPATRGPVSNDRTRTQPAPPNTPATAKGKPAIDETPETGPDRVQEILLPKPLIVAPEREPERPHTPRIEEVSDQGTPAIPGRSRVIATFSNRRRIAIPGGFHYYFEVTLKEVNGIGITWGRASIRRTSDSGFSITKDTNYDFALAAHGHYSFRIDIDLLGSTTKDWKGYVFYENSGVDENGHVMPVKLRLRLDEEFGH